MTNKLSSRLPRRVLACSVLFAAACGDHQPTAVSSRPADVPATAIQAFECTADLRSGRMHCGTAPAATGPSRTIIGGQNVYIRLDGTNITRKPTADAAVADTLQFDVTVQNLLNEAIGSPDGVATHVDGVRVFFFSGPSVTGGTGTAWVANADGEDTFLAADAPYFQYDQKLVKDEVSGFRTWKIAHSDGATSIAFRMYVSAVVQPLLVINEVLTNPKTGVLDENGEWFEVYNAGSLSVQMQGMAISDSSGAGKQKYHVIASSLLVAPSAYVVLGRNTNTAINGGVPVDYAYAAALQLGNNAADAIKISRSLTPGDTLSLFTVDRTQYASVAISAQDGVSRELKNPALDNANMDGSNWAHPVVTAEYGPGGRGTPKAQNSTFTP